MAQTNSRVQVSFSGTIDASPMITTSTEIKEGLQAAFNEFLKKNCGDFKGTITMQTVAEPQKQPV